MMAVRLFEKFIPSSCNASESNPLGQPNQPGQNPLTNAPNAATVANQTQNGKQAQGKPGTNHSKHNKDAEQPELIITKMEGK